MSVLCLFAVFSEDWLAEGTAVKRWWGQGGGLKGLSWNTCLHLTPFPLFLLELPLSTISSPPALPAPPFHPVTHEQSILQTHRLLLLLHLFFFLPQNGEGPKNLSRGLREQPTGEQVSRVYLEAPVGSITGILGRVRVKSFSKNNTAVA